METQLPRFPLELVPSRPPGAPNQRALGIFWVRGFLATCARSGLIEKSRHSLIAGDTAARRDSQSESRTRGCVLACDSQWTRAGSRTPRGWGWESLLGLLPPYLNFILGVMSLLMALPAALQHAVLCAGPWAGDLHRGGNWSRGKETPSPAGSVQAPGVCLSPDKLRQPLQRWVPTAYGRSFLALPLQKRDH